MAASKMKKPYKQVPSKPVQCTTINLLNKGLKNSALGADKHGEERPVTYTCTTYSCGPWGLEVYQPMQKNRENAHHHHQPQQQHQQDQQDKQPAQQPPEQQQQEHLQEQKQDDALFAEGRVFVRLVANMSFCLGSITVASEVCFKAAPLHACLLRPHLHIEAATTHGKCFCAVPWALASSEATLKLLCCMCASSALVCLPQQLWLLSRKVPLQEFPKPFSPEKLLRKLFMKS
eukprot:445056-Pelagomonas_calceolata.AAC.1